MSKKQIFIALGTFIILLLPLVFHFYWTISDYILATILLGSTGFGIELATRKITCNRKRILVGAGLLITGVYVWAELAVGIFTNLGS